MSIKIIKNKTCRMCDSTRFWTVLNLGRHPLVNNLVRKEDLSKKEPSFPLVLKQCQKCRLVHLVDIINSAEIYREVDYPYFSSDMPGLENYFKEYMEDVRKRFLKENDLIVEIGSNDGVLLYPLKDKMRVLGVDPATNIALRALKRGVPTATEFFSENLAKKIVKEWGKAKIIIGNNCIAHLNDIRDVMRGVKTLLSDDGVFIVEANYWGTMVKNSNYALIYHDHYSFFSLKAWQDFAKKYGMRVFDALTTPAQGGSIRLFLDKNQRMPSARLKNLEKEEKDSGLNTYAVSRNYGKKAARVAVKLRKILENIKSQNKTLAGYGAAAKGFTILTFSGIDNKFIDYIIDDSPAKQGLYSPVSRIPIISRKEASKKLPDYFLILAPNFAEVIIKKEEEFVKNGGKFIVWKGNDIDII